MIYPLYHPKEGIWKSFFKVVILTPFYLKDDKKASFINVYMLARSLVISGNDVKINDLKFMLISVVIQMGIC